VVDTVSNSNVKCGEQLERHIYRVLLLIFKEIKVQPAIGVPTLQALCWETLETLLKPEFSRSSDTKLVIPNKVLLRSKNDTAKLKESPSGHALCCLWSTGGSKVLFLLLESIVHIKRHWRTRCLTNWIPYILQEELDHMFT